MKHLNSQYNESLCYPLCVPVWGLDIVVGVVPTFRAEGSGVRFAVGNGSLFSTKRRDCLWSVHIYY
jgi:hypothetical protein